MVRPFDVEGNTGDLFGEDGPDPDVISEQRDVEGADLQSGSLDLCEYIGDGLGQGHSPGLEPDQLDRGESVVGLDDLMGHTSNRPGDSIGVHHPGVGAEDAPVGRCSATLAFGHESPRSVDASRDVT